jgi:hypothetical protein
MDMMYVCRFGDFFSVQNFLDNFYIKDVVHFGLKKSMYLGEYSRKIIMKFIIKKKIKKFIKNARNSFNKKSCKNQLVYPNFIFKKLNIYPKSLN